MNSILNSEYLFALGFFLVLFVIFKVLMMGLLSFLKNIAKKSKTHFDDFFIKIFESLKPPFYIYLAFYFAVKTLTLPLWSERVLDVVLIIWIVYQIILTANNTIDYIVKEWQVNKIDPGVISFFKTFFKIILWVIGLLLILSNFGVNVTSLVAGLGIGGIAIAFALQNIISDLFSSLAIYMDKPFRVGDYIKIAEHEGVVKNIGIKTTRIRSIDGEEIVVPNNQLVSSRVQNFGIMSERRFSTNLSLKGELNSSELLRAVSLVKSIIEKEEMVRLERVNIVAISKSANNLELVFFVLSSDKNEHFECQQKILLEIKDRFLKEEIEIV